MFAKGITMQRGAYRPLATQQPGRSAVAFRHTAGHRQRHQRLLLPGLKCRPLQPCSARPLGCSSNCNSSRRLTAYAAAEALDTEPGNWLDIDHRSRSRYVNRLNQEHSIEDFVEFHQAAGGLPAAYILHPNGHTLEIHLQGATITRWLTPDGSDLLFTRSDATFAPGEPINSGIPIAFPQWRDGRLPFNGFADKLQWEVVGTDLDFQFVNSLATAEDFREGRAELLLDQDGNSLVPAPVGLIDADDFDDDEELLADMDEDLDAVYAEDEAEAAPTKTKTRGRKPKAAATETAADLDTAAEAEAADPAAADPAGSSSGTSSDEEQEAEALTAAAAAAGEGEEGEEGEGDVDFGIIEDPAPYIILKLSDNEDTRAIWPHKFDLYYKITLMETDEFPDPKAGFPAGVHEWTGSDRPLRPEHEEFLEALDTGDEELIQNTANDAALAEAKELAAVEGGQLSYNGYRMYTDDDGHFVEEDDSDLLEALMEDDQSAAAAKGKGRGRKKKEQEPAVDAEAVDADADGDVAPSAAAAEADEAEELDDELPRELYDPPEQPMQIKMEWILMNKDDEGSPPFEFQLGALSHLRTQDQLRYGEFVRILGLGGVVTFDYSEDPRKAKLVGCQDDYVEFNGQRRDTLYIGSHDADVMFCPGNRTHFQLICREGLQDHVVYHPGALGLPTLYEDERYMAQVGAGRMALPKKLAAGDMWKGEYVLRFNPTYWDPPVFDRDGPQPLPQIQTKQDEADDLDGLEDVDDRVEGLDSSSLGGGAAVPYLDE